MGKKAININQVLSSELFPGEGNIHMDDDLLFHYTSAEGFFSIIKNLTLKTSRLPKLNDLNEIDYESFVKLPIAEMTKYRDYINKQCSIVCFSHHTLYPYKQEGSIIIPGCCNPSMWAHYAGNVSGVCLCLDKNELLKENKKIFGDNNVDIQKVHYDVVFERCQPKNTAKEFIEENGHNIFFLKDPSWKNESEVRLLLKNINPNIEEPKISIANSLKGIVFSNRFGDNIKKEFLEEVIRPNSFLGSMCPMNWFVLMSSHVAYEIQSGFPLNLEEELNYMKKDMSEKTLLVQSYIERLRRDYCMTI